VAFGAETANRRKNPRPAEIIMAPPLRAKCPAGEAIV
jgi:hypothetical protein